jgi:hypothetical protein
VAQHQVQAPRKEPEIMFKSIQLILVLAASSFAQSSLIDSFVTDFNKSNFAAITTLYRYPETQDKKSHREDSATLVGFYSELHSHWGNILKADKYKMCDSCLLLSVSLCSADSSYWNHQSFGDTLLYKLKTTKKDSIFMGFRTRTEDHQMKIGYFDIHAILKQNLTESDRRDFMHQCEVAMHKLQTEFNDMVNRAMKSKSAPTNK